MTLLFLPLFPIKGRMSVCGAHTHYNGNVLRKQNRSGRQSHPQSNCEKQRPPRPPSFRAPLTAASQPNLTNPFERGDSPIKYRWITPIIVATQPLLADNSSHVVRLKGKMSVRGARCHFPCGGKRGGSRELPFEGSATAQRCRSVP